ncbi:MAG: hypothetical protein R3C44_00875 [Chloroflexota bacterium]
MPSGQTRGDLFLRPLRILPATSPEANPPLETGDVFTADVRADE